MKEIFLGEYIKQKRLELGLTQEKLCCGICEPITISRLENGKQTPSRNNINAILQRLGLPSDRYFALLNENEKEIVLLQNEIISLNIQCYNVLPDKKREIVELAYEKIQSLEKIAGEDDKLIKQFILRSKVLLGKKNGESYSLSEQLSLLQEALLLTSPNFDLDSINQALYTLDEIKIINQIAGVYSELGENITANEILQQLLKYIKKHLTSVIESGGYLPLVTHNYARTLILCKRYEEAYEIANTGYQSCIQLGHYQHLPGLLHCLAIICFYLNEEEKSKMFFRQSFYLYQAIGNESDAKLLCEDAHQMIGLDFE